MARHRAALSRYAVELAKRFSAEVRCIHVSDIPADLLAIEVGFLNGQESPTIETAEADFKVLGIHMRGYHDFGVALQDASVTRVESPAFT